MLLLSNFYNYYLSNLKHNLILYNISLSLDLIVLTSKILGKILNMFTQANKAHLFSKSLPKKCCPIIISVKPFVVADGSINV